MSDSDIKKLSLNDNVLEQIFKLKPNEKFDRKEFKIEPIYKGKNNFTYKVELIANNLFEDCQNLEKVVLPDDFIETIGSNAFKGCSKLFSINLPKSLKTIENNAFEGCTSLSSLSEPFIIPSTVTFIGDDAFKKLHWVHYEGKANIGKCGAYKITTKSEELPDKFRKPKDGLWSSGVNAVKDGFNNMFKSKKDNSVSIDVNQKEQSSINQLSNHQSKIQQVTQQQTTKINQEKDVVNELQIAQKEIEQLKQDKLILENKYIDEKNNLIREYGIKIKEANENAKRYLDDYNKVKQEYESFTNEFQNELTEKDVTIGNLQTQIKDKEKEIEKQGEQIYALDNAVKISPIIDALIGKVVDVIDKKANAIAEVKAVEQTTNLAKILANEEKQRLDRELDDKNRELNDLKEQVKNKEDELKQRLEYEKKDKEKIEKLEEDISLKDGTIKELSSQVVEEKGKVQQLETEKVNLGTEKTKLQNENKTLQENNAILFQKNSDKKSKIESLNSEIEHLKNTHAEVLDKKDKELRDLMSNSSDSYARELAKKQEEFDKEIQKYKLESDNLQSQKDKIVKELEEYKSVYSDFDELFELYKKLPEPVKIPLQNLFGKENSVVSIAFNITKTRNVESFWQFICDRIDKNELPDQIDNLKKIFDITFKLLHISDSNYVLLETNEGDIMNNTTMRRKLGSPQNGVVKTVFLKGIKYQANNRIIKQSLVLLG